MCTTALTSLPMHLLPIRSSVPFHHPSFHTIPFLLESLCHLECLKMTGVEIGSMAGHDQWTAPSSSSSCQHSWFQQYGLKCVSYVAWTHIYDTTATLIRLQHLLECFLIRCYCFGQWQCQFKLKRIRLCWRFFHNRSIKTIIKSWLRFHKCLFIIHHVY